MALRRTRRRATEIELTATQTLLNTRIFPRPEANPLVFSFGAIINNNIKYLHKPSVGQCNKEVGTVLKGPLLFDLDKDPTESNDLSASQPGLFQKMQAQWTAFEGSVTHSTIHESQCDTGAPSPSPSPPAPPFPPTPPAEGVQLLHGAGGSCLTMTSSSDHPQARAVQHWRWRWRWWWWRTNGDQTAGARQRQCPWRPQCPWLLLLAAADAGAARGPPWIHGCCCC